MATSSPETYKGLLPKANQLCEEAEKILLGKDEDGFIRLIRWGDIDNIVDQLSEMLGRLKEKIRELNAYSLRKKDYEDMLHKIEKVKIELSNKRIKRSRH